MSIASRYRHACSPSSPRTSSRKKWGRIRLPMNRPCRSVNMHRTVSTSPSSTRDSSCLTVNVPCWGMGSSLRRRYSRHRRSRLSSDEGGPTGPPSSWCPPASARLARRGVGARLASEDRFLLGLARDVALLRNAGFPLREGELFLRRQHQPVPSGDREVQHAEDVVDRHAVDAGPV